MKRTLSIIGICLAVILLILNLFALCKVMRFKGSTNTVYTSSSDTLYLEKVIEKVGTVNNYTITQSTPLNVPEIVDTPKVITDYYTQNVFSSTFEDSVLSYRRFDTVKMNRLSGSYFSYKVRFKEKVITNTIVEKPKNSFYIGGALSLRTVKVDTLFMGISPVIGYSFQKYNLDFRYELPTKRASVTLIKKF
jgi:hypothetical protein